MISLCVVEESGNLSHHLIPEAGACTFPDQAAPGTTFCPVLGTRETMLSLLCGCRYLNLGLPGFTASLLNH